jgi:hypothetical protein
MQEVAAVLGRNGSRGTRLQGILGTRRKFSEVAAALPGQGSVEVIEGFRGIRNLEVIRSASESELRRMSGFWACESLYLVEIPSSVEVMDCFNHGHFLGNVRFEIHPQIREIEGFCGCS